MMPRSLFLLTAVTSAAAGKSAIDSSTGDIKANSKIGNNILSKARALDGNQDFSWVANYSIRFEKCSASTDYYGGYFGGNGNNNNGGGNNRNNFNGMYEQRFVHFKLCPSDSCDSCEGGADYVIDMDAFVEAYIESKLTAQEYNCEMVRENCYCENANDDEACEYQCYLDAGLDYCDQDGNKNGQNGNGQNQFDLEEAMECRKLDVDEDAVYYYMSQNQGGNNYQNQYYNQRMEFFVGPYCSKNGKSIFLGVFMDETCSYPAPDGVYEKFNYGQSLPYSSESLVESSCISCAEPQDYDQQNNNDQQDEDEVADVCERLYEDSGKCESDLNIYYPNTLACDFIKSLKAGEKKLSVPKVAVTSKALAGLFAATTVAFGGVAYYFHQQLKRSNVNLSDQGGEMA